MKNQKENRNKNEEKRCDYCGVYSHSEKHMFGDMSGTYCSDCWQGYVENHNDETRCHDEEVI